MLLACLALTAAAVPVREVRVVMGTTAEVRVDPGLAEPLPALAAAFAALDIVDSRLSLWKESELTRLNRSGTATASPELKAVLAHALDVFRASGGAFDPTVEPLVRADGHLADPPRRLSRRERARLQGRVGATQVHFDEASAVVRLDHGTTLDFGGIAKGYAVDLALDALRRVRAVGGVVDLGSSSLGVFGVPLTVAVRDPDLEEAPPWAEFELRGAALGTSGADQRPGHILDPRTGLPARQVLVATVVAATAMEADALSTAVFVLGPRDGLALLTRRGAEGFVLVREDGRPTIRTTPGFAQRHRLSPAPGVAVRP